MNAITEENWAANADRREHDRAVKALNEHKKRMKKQKYVRIDRKTVIGFSGEIDEQVINDFTRNLR